MSKFYVIRNWVGEHCAATSLELAIRGCDPNHILEVSGAFTCEAADAWEAGRESGQKNLEEIDNTVLLLALCKYFGVYTESYKTERGVTT